MLGAMRRITFSRNYTLSLSRTCRCYCKYCAFATHQAHVHTPAQVEQHLEQAVRRNAKELLVLTGEAPEVNPIVAEKLAGWGHQDFTSYVAWACERALERGLGRVLGRYIPTAKNAMVGDLYERLGFEPAGAGSEPEETLWVYDVTSRPLVENDVIRVEQALDSAA